MQTFENTVGANVVESEAITLVRSSDNTEVGTSAQPLRIDPVGTTIQPDNVSQWGGTSVSAPPASTVPQQGTEVAPVTKPLQRKFTQIISTTNLGANGVFTSSWYDTQPTGDTSLNVTWASNTNPVSVNIQETDDTSSSILNSSGHWGGLGSQLFITCQIRCRYWRVVYTNGAVAQTTFELTSTSSSMSQSVSVSAINANGYPLSLTVQNDGALIMVPDNGGFVSEASAGIRSVYIGGVQNLMNPVSTWVQHGTPGTDGNMAALRDPNIFKTASVPATASGNTAVWTPTASKKFRLMRFQITATDVAATAATVITVSFQDATTGINIGTYDFFMPAIANVASGTQFVSNWVDLGNGYLSTAANNVLNANVSATVAGATGTFRYNVCGTEE